MYPTTSTWPQIAAWCRVVKPNRSTTLKSAPDVTAAIACQLTIRVHIKQLHINHTWRGWWLSFTRPGRVSSNFGVTWHMTSVMLLIFDYILLSSFPLILCFMALLFFLQTVNSEGTLCKNGDLSQAGLCGTHRCGGVSSDSVLVVFFCR